METITIIDKCSVLGTDYAITVPKAGWLRWKQGELIQNALPDADADTREFLKTKISPQGWEMIFGPKDNTNKNKTNNRNAT